MTVFETFSDFSNLKIVGIPCIIRLKYDWKINVEESEERRKCFLNVRLMFAKIRGIFEMNKVFNKNIISVITM